MIGLGNPLMGEDAFGGKVIEYLRLEVPDLPPQVDLVDVHTDLISQIERFPEYEQVVLVDALLIPEDHETGSGQILLLEERSMLAWPETSASAHQLSPLMAVRLFRLLYPHAPTQIHLVALNTKRISFGPGTGKTPGILTAEIIDAAARTVRELVQS